MRSKIYLLITSLVFMLFISKVDGQVKRTFGNNFHFEGRTTDYRFMIRQSSGLSISDTALYRAISFYESYSFEDRRDKAGNIIKNINDSIYRKVELGITLMNEPNSPIMLGVKLNPNLKDFRGADVASYSKTFPSYTISDSSDAIIIGLGITPENVRNFKYRVVENDSIEVVGWSPIPLMEQKYGAKKPYAFIGNFNKPGKQLLIEVVDCNNYSIRDGVILNWRINYKPVINQIAVQSPDGFFNLRYSKLNHNYATKFDSVTGMPLDLKFPVDSITSFRVYFKSHPTIPYAVYLNKEIFGRDKSERIDWWILKDYADFDRHNFNTPGKYEVVIQRAGLLDEFGPENALRIRFEVTSSSEKQFSAKQVITYGLISLLILFIVAIGYYIYNKQKQTYLLRQKEKMSFRLKSIRSQLNPHFMFNALNSIQNLMNKNDVQAANHYLTKFASLTRKVLDIGEQDLISLEDEITLLDDYLQMEKLRFGFNYIFIVDENLNKSNIEIPAMLIQPLVENAVKHGVALLKGKGQIELGFTKNNNDLILSIKDNGGGFQKKEIGIDIKGLGLKLSKERIALLNKTFTSQQITMEFISEPTGTKVDIVLSNWL